MAAIITLTLNPALDKSTSVHELLPARKLKCAAPVYRPGGGGINVARAIKKLGGEATAIYLAGGDNGNKITGLLVAEGVKTRVCPIAAMSRENLILMDNATHKQYLLDMPGPEIAPTEWKACLGMLSSIKNIAYLVVSGSLPSGVPPGILADIAAIARDKNARLIVDTSGESLKQAVQAGVYLIKPNLKELGMLAGKTDIDEHTALECCKAILQNGNCEAIAVSMGPQNVLLVTRKQALKIKPPQVEVESTVGAGDSMVAGIVLALSSGKDLIEAVRYGVACGTAATLKAGTELCSKEDAEHLYRMLAPVEAVV